MSRIDRNRARKERRASRSGAGISQIGFGPLNNRYPPINPLSEAQVEEIATIKMPDLNANDIAAAKLQVRGTARSMGITVS